jgi:hypothetical protein
MQKGKPLKKGSALLKIAEKLHFTIKKSLPADRNNKA